jgi:hypothetical protein
MALSIHCVNLFQHLVSAIDFLQLLGLAIFALALPVVEIAEAWSVARRALKKLGDELPWPPRFQRAVESSFTSELTLALVRRPDLLPWRVRRVPGKCCGVDVEPVGANGLPPDYPVAQSC